MNRTLTISETLYGKLEAEASQRGFRTIEQLLEAQHASPISQEELEQRQEAMKRVEELQEIFSAKYGMMPDSAALVREDRNAEEQRHPGDRQQHNRQVVPVRSVIGASASNSGAV